MERIVPKERPLPKKRPERVPDVKASLSVRQMWIAEIRTMSTDQMNVAVLNLKKERFNLRFQRATGQLQNTTRLREARREIARIKTIAAQQRAKLR